MTSLCAHRKREERLRKVLQARERVEQMKEEKKKPIEQIAPAALGVDPAPRLKTVKVEEPAKRKAGVKVKDVAELIEKLRNEAKVI